MFSVPDITQDWSDYEMWWPRRNKWLMNSNHALVREEVQADAELWFTTKHKTLRIQLPDLQYANIRVDFSSRIFASVKEISRFFGEFFNGGHHGTLVWKALRALAH